MGNSNSKNIQYQPQPMVTNASYPQPQPPYPTGANIFQNIPYQPQPMVINAAYSQPQPPYPTGASIFQNIPYQPQSMVINAAHQQQPYPTGASTFQNILYEPQPVVTNASYQQQPYPTGANTFQFPTRWTMPQSWFGSDMHIKDSSGRSIYSVEAKFGSMSWNLSIFDTQSGTLLGKIKEKERLMALPKFSIILGDAEYATIKNKSDCCSYKFRIKSRNGPISIEGDWLAHSYTFKRGGYTIATVEKAWPAPRDKYTVDIAAGENVIFILCCCIVLDKCCTED